MKIGEQTLVLNDRTFKDFADGTIISLAYGGAVVNRSINRDYSSNFARNVENAGATLTVRLKRGSSDEIYLTSLYNSIQGSNFGKTEELAGTLTQELWESNRVNNEVWSLSAGVVVERNETIFNIGGDTEQCATVFTILLMAKKSNE